MKETLELRVNPDFAHLLFGPTEGRMIGTSARVVQLGRDDPRYEEIPNVARQVKERYGRGFFFSWRIIRRYSDSELRSALMFHVKVTTTFEPAGEECGTEYDETVACDICGVGRKQIGPLRLKRGRLPKKDIARTIAGEVIVSKRFADTLARHQLTGVSLQPVVFNGKASGFSQLAASSPQLGLSEKTIAGDDPFTSSSGSSGGVHNIGGYDIVFEKEVYKCPRGHTIGLNLISEPYVLDSPAIGQFDFFTSRQMTGVKRGLLRPEPVYLCSRAFRKMVEEERLKGFEFEVAHIETTGGTTNGTQSSS